MFTKEELKKIADAAQEKKNERFLNDCKIMTDNIIEECKEKAENGYYSHSIKIVITWSDKWEIVIKNLTNLGYKAHKIVNPFTKEEKLIVSWED